MAVTAAVVLGCTFLPIAGGAPKPYELREFAAWATGGRIASLEHAVHPEWGGVQTVAVIDEGVRMTTAALVPEAAAVEVEDMAGGEEAEIAPVVHVVEAPADICAGACAVEALPMADEEAIVEAPELDELEEIAPLDMGD